MIRKEKCCKIASGFETKAKGPAYLFLRICSLGSCESLMKPFKSSSKNFVQSWSGERGVVNVVKGNTFQIVW